MAAQVPTPFTSGSPNPETAATGSEPAPKKRKRGNREDRTFEVQQKSERQYYRSYISGTIRSKGKWDKWPREQRWDTIRGKWEELVEHRLKHRMCTMKNEYAGEYDEGKELAWLRTTFHKQIEYDDPSGYGADEDDDEELPTAPSMKEEPTYDEGYGRDNVRATTSRSFSKPAEEAGRDLSREPIAFEVVSSGLAIKSGSAAFLDAEARTETKRSWTWVNGKLVVWPAFGTTLADSNSKRKTNKVAEVVTAERGQKRRSL